MNKERWQQLMADLGIVPETSLETYEALVAAYSQKHRRYHTTAHIEYCLSEFDKARALANEPAEVEIALWFHDAIYDPYASGNEEKSADWACEFLTSKSVKPERIARIR